MTELKRIRIKTIWQGCVAIRDKQIKEAKERGQGLALVVGEEIMIIPHSQIDGLAVAISEHPVKDYFSNDLHRLIYYKWVPSSANQGKLF